MATSRDTFESVIYVNDEQANDAIAKMTKRMADLNAEYESLKTKNGELHKDTLKKKKDIDSLQKSIDGVKKGVDKYIFKNKDQLILVHDKNFNMREKTEKISVFFC